MLLIPEIRGYEYQQNVMMNIFTFEKTEIKNKRPGMANKKVQLVKAGKAIRRASKGKGRQATTM